jgi:hypothetical protein
LNAFSEPLLGADRVQSHLYIGGNGLRQHEVGNDVLALDVE